VLPVLFDEKLGFFESWRPVVSVAKRTESVITLVVRLGLTIFIAYLAYIVYLDPNSVTDLKDEVYDVLTNVFDWGEEHMKNLHNSTALRIKDNKHLNLMDEDDD